MAGIGFTVEFKRDAGDQVVDRGYSVAEVSERLGISTKSLYKWTAQFSKPRKPISEATEQAEEIRRLKKELARVSEERDILKRARLVRHWSEDNAERVLRQGWIRLIVCKQTTAGRRVRYAFMTENRPLFSVRGMCRCLRLHPSGFYA